MKTTDSATPLPIRAKLSAVSRLALLLPVLLLPTPRLVNAEEALPAAAKDPAENDAAPESGLYFNLATRTLGGKQFWTDEVVYHDWRVQRHCLTGHCRLVDDRNVRRGWGDFEQCVQLLERAKQEQQIPPLRSRTIIVLHGLVRSRESMDELVEYLRQDEQYSVLNVSYASSRGKLADHATALARVVEHLPGVTEVSFVGHSLGNLVVRHYLADRERGIHQGKETPAVGRIVMIAPPNQGAELARRFQDNYLFQTIWGAAGKQLATGWSQLASKLAIPSAEFGIIAGGRGDNGGLNPWVAGDDDLVVSVEETQLPGAADFLVCPAYHGTIMEQDQVKQATLQFLKHGYFVSPTDRHPLPPAETNE